MIKFIFVSEILTENIGNQFFFIYTTQQIYIQLRVGKTNTVYENANKKRDTYDKATYIDCIKRENIIKDITSYKGKIFQN